MITRSWRVAKVLETYPDTLEVFVEASPHFKKLRNPLLRRVLAPRVTVEQAAAIGGVDVVELLERLNAVAGAEYVREDDRVEEPSGARSEEAGRIVDVIGESVSAGNEVLLDVRPIIASGSDPLKTILQTIRRLEENQALHLINSFEPIPLYSVLGERGFRHFTKRLGDAWHIWFFRSDAIAGRSDKAKERMAEQSTDALPEEIVELDVRGLPPPEPMMRILARLEEVGDHAILVVHHHREPMMLYEKLEQRGFVATTECINDHYYKVIIRKKPIHLQE